MHHIQLNFCSPKFEKQVQYSTIKKNLQKPLEAFSKCFEHLLILSKYFLDWKQILNLESLHHIQLNFCSTPKFEKHVQYSTIKKNLQNPLEAFSKFFEHLLIFSKYFLDWKRILDLESLHHIQLNFCSPKFEKQVQYSTIKKNLQSPLEAFSKFFEHLLILSKYFLDWKRILNLESLHHIQLNFCSTPKFEKHVQYSTIKKDLQSPLEAFSKFFEHLLILSKYFSDWKRILNLESLHHIQLNICSTPKFEKHVQYSTIKKNPQNPLEAFSKFFEHLLIFSKYFLD